MQQPPNTEFYQDSKHHHLWRELAHLHDEYVSDETSSREFVRILSDAMWRLQPIVCQQCGANVENVALNGDTLLQCLVCGWKPVTIRKI